MLLSNSAVFGTVLLKDHLTIASAPIKALPYSVNSKALLADCAIGKKGLVINSLF
jgi:hypothetical protein